LIDALRRAGLSAIAVPWNTPGFDYRSVRACVIRSTWDYHLHRDAFVRWARAVEGSTRLWNGARVVEWNTHKRYLRDLAERGIAIVPTEWIRQGEDVQLHQTQVADWAELVVKPAVSAGAHRTSRFTSAQLAQAQAHARQIAETGEVLVQPYLPSVESSGERSLIFFEGRASHAVRRRAALAPGATPNGDAEAVPMEPDERAFAIRVLEAVGEVLLYARVDLARDQGGALCLMELELVEPSLFLRLEATAADTFAAAMARRL
jgi:glutathione synthase/RimK-type ligase-like ATP-grasp enzyme